MGVDGERGGGAGREGCWVGGLDFFLLVFLVCNWVCLFYIALPRFCVDCDLHFGLVVGGNKIGSFFFFFVAYKCG